MKGLFIISALGILAMLAEIFKFKKLLYMISYAKTCRVLVVLVIYSLSALAQKKELTDDQYFKSDFNFITI